jgi:hypothetical protein
MGLEIRFIPNGNKFSVLHSFRNLLQLTLKIINPLDYNCDLSFLFKLNHLEIEVSKN